MTGPGLPLANPFQGMYGGGAYDAYVAEINRNALYGTGGSIHTVLTADGSDLVASSRLARTRDFLTSIITTDDVEGEPVDVVAGGCGGDSVEDPVITQVAELYVSPYGVRLGYWYQDEGALLLGNSFAGALAVDCDGNALAAVTDVTGDNFDQFHPYAGAALLKLNPFGTPELSVVISPTGVATGIVLTPDCRSFYMTGWVLDLSGTPTTFLARG